MIFRAISTEAEGEMRGRATATALPVSSEWRAADWLGALGVRLGIGRSRYRVEPGLCALGSPGKESPVFVSANYKLSFDHLRRALAGLDAWILVLDTRGINVWCAAGKGSFGTHELVKRIQVTGLTGRVSHRLLILPQLAAPGVAAHAVQAMSGFRVQYGPVLAADIKPWLEAGRKKTAAMRRVAFTLKDRLVLAPLEAIQALPLMAAVAFLGIALELLESRVFSAGILWGALPLALASVAGSVGVPVLLPLLPGRSFALKGAVMGLAAGAALWAGTALAGVSGWSTIKGLAILLAMGALAAWEGLAFTGSSTYTNLQGVRKDMRYSLPAAVAAGVVSIGLRLFEALALKGAL